ncbi:hypothetical protein TorRG33x02_271990 [Trema orientale]|uniref:Uncharacterized protein n=1 Tax=Trema orientale TaxID=63057 RepID=A0A2P5CVC5_TREOI|nr:hypothetical protein TorRG33x02_271990 [Trema orientale]
MVKSSQKSSNANSDQTKEHPSGFQGYLMMVTEHNGSGDDDDLMTVTMPVLVLIEMLTRYKRVEG